MRQTLLAALAASCLVGCATEKPDSGPAANARYSFWRPAPVVDAPDPNKVVQESPAEAWRPIDPSNLLVVDLKEGGRVVIELAPEFAPVHVANVRAFAGTAAAQTGRASPSGPVTRSDGAIAGSVLTAPSWR